MSGPALILMIGLPGTGKSYLATRLARRMEAVLVQTDAIRKELFPSPTYAAAESDAVYREAHRRIEGAVGAGRQVVFDATNLHESSRRRAYRIAQEAGADLYPLWIWSPDWLVARRLDQRRTDRDPEDVSDATWHVYRRMASQAEPPSRPFAVLNSTLHVDVLLVVVEQLLEHVLPQRVSQRPDGVRMRAP